MEYAAGFGGGRRGGGGGGGGAAGGGGEEECLGEGLFDGGGGLVGHVVAIGEGEVGFLDGYCCAVVRSERRGSRRGMVADEGEGRHCDSVWVVCVFSTLPAYTRILMPALDMSPPFWWG